MSLKQQIEKDLKQALLSGDKTKSGTLRILKSAILNEEIARGERENGLNDEDVLVCFKKEAKKRQEAADLYKQAGSNDRAEQELSEKVIIEQYLPAAMPEAELQAIVDDVVVKQGGVTQQTMGKIIGEVRQATNGRAHGGDIARLVKAKLS